ncbi:MAG: hypothetical protein FWE44_03885 [Defluviitaleaceae bacterium]|nr:hypothetical protein [Defluviitaleaceae bacterium]
MTNIRRISKAPVILTVVASLFILSLSFVLHGSEVVLLEEDEKVVGNLPNSFHNAHNHYYSGSETNLIRAMLINRFANSSEFFECTEQEATFLIALLEEILSSDDFTTRSHALDIKIYSMQPSNLSKDAVLVSDIVIASSQPILRNWSGSPEERFDLIGLAFTYEFSKYVENKYHSGILHFFQAIGVESVVNPDITHHLSVYFGWIYP